MASFPQSPARQLRKLQVPKTKFKADTRWIHIFRDFVHSGACAELGPYSAIVLLVIKSYTDFETGQTFPSIDTITEKSGISRRKVISSLADLEKAGYLARIRDGKSNNYIVKERIQVLDASKQPVAVATWDYLPKAISRTRAELRNFLLDGTLPEESGPRPIYIKQLCLNLQIVESGGTGTQIIGGKANDR